MGQDTDVGGPCVSAPELRLLLDSVVALPRSAWQELPTSDDADVEELYAALLAGEWEHALRLPAVLSALGVDRQSLGGEDADERVLAAGRSASLAVFSDGDGGSREALIILGTAVALLNIFVAANFTGPPPTSPRLPADMIAGNEGSVDAVHRERAGARQLMIDGEELVGKVSCSHCLLLAMALLLDPLPLPSVSSEAEPPDTAASTWTPCASWSLWALRVVSIHQRVVSRRSATLRGRQRVLSAVLEEEWGRTEWANTQVQHACGGAGAMREWYASVIGGVCLMELAALEDVYGDTAAAARHLQAAGNAFGLQLELTGVMGKRTMHQVDEVAQMVATVKRTGGLAAVSDLERAAAEEQVFAKRQSERDEGSRTSSIPKEMKWQDSSDGMDVMEMPKLEVDTSSLGLNDLTSVEQLLLLRAAIHEKKKEALDEELQMWRMAPFVEAVISQQYADFSVRLAGQLMRARHEFTRSRTKQRGFLRFQDIVDNTLNSDGGSAAARIRGIHAAPAPCLPGLRSEFAKKMLAIGLVGEAMRLLEELELWDSLIVCYTTMDKKLQALEIIKQQLLERPDESSLLCALGDVTGDVQAYHTAWEKSEKRSARAMRSLADAAHRKKDYAESAKFWEAALSLNPIHSSGWFSLGHCYLKNDELDKAVHAFTRCCQLDTDNGASWNNIAAICLTQKKYKEAFVALQESSKHLRENWHTWDNYVQVAILLENFSQALHGIHHMLRLRHGKDIPLEALSAVVSYLEKPSAEETENNVRLMMGRLEEILKAVAQVGGSEPYFWRIFARFHALRGHPTVERECLLKCTRGLTGGAWHKHETQFVQIADASGALAEATLVCVAGGSCGRRELSQARLQLRGVLKQAEENFDEHAEFQKLSTVLERVMQKEEELSSEEGMCESRDSGARVIGHRSIRDSLRDC